MAYEVDSTPQAQRGNAPLSGGSGAGAGNLSAIVLVDLAAQAGQMIMY